MRVANYVGEMSILVKILKPVEYLEWITEKGSKTRTGQEGGHKRAFYPKAYAIPDKSTKSSYPVEAL